MMDELINGRCGHYVISKYFFQLQLFTWPMQFLNQSCNRIITYPYILLYQTITDGHARCCHLTLKSSFMKSGFGVRFYHIEPDRLRAARLLCPQCRDISYNAARG
jgi:hypothetical protein